MSSNLTSAKGGPPPPLRILCAIASPSDRARFDVVRVWQEITGALEPFTARGSVVVEQLPASTETALRQKLAKNCWDVVYFAGHAQARAASYATVSLVASDGRARNLTAAALANLLAGSPTVRLAIFQACDDSCSFDGIADCVKERGVTAITFPAHSAVQPLLAKVCAGVLQQFAAKVIMESLPALARGFVKNPGDPIIRIGGGATASETGSPALAPTIEPAPAASHLELQRKRAAGAFDVFLCHNSGDKPSVKRIGQRLKEAGILPWLDVWELPPGQLWQRLLEQQIGSIRAAAVFVGSGGLGPWQEQEMYGFLHEFVTRKSPVIPVLLSDAPSKPDLPIFLRAMTWVDFRAEDPDPFAQLLWGITGERPDR